MENFIKSLATINKKYWRLRVGYPYVVRILSLEDGNRTQPQLVLSNCNCGPNWLTPTVFPTVSLQLHHQPWGQWLHNLPHEWHEQIPCSTVHLVNQSHDAETQCPSVELLLGYLHPCQRHLQHQHCWKHHHFACLPPWPTSPWATLGGATTENLLIAQHNINNLRVILRLQTRRFSCIFNATVLTFLLTQLRLSLMISHHMLFFSFLNQLQPLLTLLCVGDGLTDSSYVAMHALGCCRWLSPCWAASHPIATGRIANVSSSPLLNHFVQHLRNRSHINLQLRRASVTRIHWRPQLPRKANYLIEKFSIPSLTVRLPLDRPTANNKKPLCQSTSMQSLPEFLSKHHLQSGDLIWTQKFRLSRVDTTHTHRIPAAWFSKAFGRFFHMASDHQHHIEICWGVHRSNPLTKAK